MEAFLKIIFMVLGSLILIFFVAALFAFPVMWIWNYLMPELFGLPSIVFWQAFWMPVLAQLIFGVNTNSE